MKKVEIYPKGCFFVDDEDFPKFEGKTWSISSTNSIANRTASKAVTVIKTLFPDRKQNAKYIHKDGNKMNFQKANIADVVPLTRKESRDKHNLKQSLKRNAYLPFHAPPAKKTPRFLNGESYFD